MSLFLDKLLTVFVLPLGAALVLGIVGLALSFTRWRNLARAALAIVVVGLWIAATPLFSHWIAAKLEGRYPPRPVDDMPKADAIVVLGGYLGQPLPPRVTSDLTDAADRVFEAARLYRAGKAPRIVVSGGNLPWYPSIKPEAALAADLLVELGVPRADLVLEGESRTTRENAVNTAKIFAANGWTSGLLVTSGMHMPRALAVFSRVGLDMTPATTDVSAQDRGFGGLFVLLPDAEELNRTTLAVKEIIGGFVYRHRGWE